VLFPKQSRLGTSPLTVDEASHETVYVLAPRLQSRPRKTSGNHQGRRRARRRLPGHRLPGCQRSAGYSDETPERVETAVKSLSYETDCLARGLKTRQTSAFGLLAPMVSDALASQVMQGVEEEAQAGVLSGLTHAAPTRKRPAVSGALPSGRRSSRGPARAPMKYVLEPLVSNLAAWPTD